MNLRPEGLHVVDHPGSNGAVAPRTGGRSVDVILVHGSLDRGASFTRVVRRLPDLHVVTYDRRGYSRSRQAGQTATFIDHVADLVALAGAGPVVAIGHSYGGDIALGAALAAPGTVVAVGAYEPPMPWLDWWPRRSRPEDDPATFAEGFFRRMVGDTSWDRLTEQARAERRADGAALRAELTDLRGDEAPFDASALSVPAVFGRGECSIPRHRRAVGELHAAVAGSEIVEFDGAGHGAHLSHPGAFAQFVRRVLLRVS